MRRLSWLLLLPLVVACSDRVPVTIELAVAAPDGPCGGSRPTEPLASLGAALLRVTVTTRSTPVSPPELLCDQLVDVGSGGGAARLELETSTTDRMDLRVEAFDASQPPQLLAAGGAVGINRTPRLAPLGILLAPAGSPACTPEPLATARAFHTATLLPNGEVLLIGGVSHAGPAAVPNGLWINDTIEVYDPRTGTSRPATGDLPAGRALHTAVLLSPADAGGPFDVLLVGGISARSDGAPEPVLQVGTDADPLPLVPGPGAVPAASVIVRYYPWADPPQVQRMTDSPVLEPRMLHAAAAVGDRVVLLGGALDVSGGQLATVDDFEVLPTGGSSVHEGPFPLGHPRVGAVAAALTPDSVLVFGGNLGSASEADVVADAAEVVSLESEAAAAPAVFEPSSLALLAPIAYGTLTPTPSGLLLAGGLTVAPGRAREVQAVRPVLRLSQVEDGLRIDEVPTTGFEPVAYHAAAALPDGDVLLSGGAAATCGTGPLCASTGVYRYSANATALGSEGRLLTPRLGHAMTVLDDGTVLVTGGLSVEGASLVALGSGELFAPPPEEGAADVFGRGAGKVSGRSCQ